MKNINKNIPFKPTNKIDSVKNIKNISVLGSTGSIGRNTLKIAAMHPDKFKITALAAANNVKLLAEQINFFRPEIAVVIDENRADELKHILQHYEGSNKPLNKLSGAADSYDYNCSDKSFNKLSDSANNPVDTEIYWGDYGYNLAASYKNADTVLLAMVGAAGLMPALAAIDAGKDIALANKETLVMAGELVIARALEKNVNIYPVDSEHSAIFQCIRRKCCIDDKNNESEYIKKIFLTASGGPFRKTSLEKFKDITPENALSHPTWSMGSKITIDSATLMNKALEIIEAVRLFNISVSDIEVLIHPQSIVHSMVGFCDGSIIAQLGLPDMKTAISYALSFPERLDIKIDFPDFTSLGTLIFEKPDRFKFPSLDFAYEACRQGGTLPAVMNAANEIAVNAFLSHQINFPAIFKIIENTMKIHTNNVKYTLDDVIHADKWAREAAASLI